MQGGYAWGWGMLGSLRVECGCGCEVGLLGRGVWKCCLLGMVGCNTTAVAVAGVVARISVGRSGG